MSNSWKQWWHYGCVSASSSKRWKYQEIQYGTRTEWKFRSVASCSVAQFLSIHQNCATLPIRTAPRVSTHQSKMVFVRIYLVVASYLCDMPEVEDSLAGKRRITTASGCYMFQISKKGRMTLSRQRSLLGTDDPLGNLYSRKIYTEYLMKTDQFCSPLQYFQSFQRDLCIHVSTFMHYSGVAHARMCK